MKTAMTKTRSPLRALLPLMALGAAVAPTSASAKVSNQAWQCALRPAAQTGDLYPDRYGWASSSGMLKSWVLSPFGMSSSAWNRDFNGNTCASTSLASFSVPDCASRRIMNALTAMEDVTVSGKTWSWKAWAESRVDVLKPSSQCANLWGLNDPTWNGQLNSTSVDSVISLMGVPLFNMNVFDRAAILIHEARHDDKPHNANGQCTNTTTSCDSSWGFAGSNAYQVWFYQDVLSSWDVQITPALRAEALEHANYFINGFFAAHPGFNLKEEDGPSAGYGDAEQVGWTWSSGTAQAAYFADPAGPTDAITEVGLAMSGGAIVHLRVCWSTVVSGATGTSLANPACADYGRNTGAALDVSLPVPAGRVATRVKVATSGGSIASLCVYNRSLQGGVPMTGSAYACQGAAPSTGYDVDLSASDGHFLTGLGFGASGGKITGWAMSQSLAPDFEDLAGSLGGSASLLACPSGQVPMGLMANDVYSSTWHTDVVGYMGILCADPAWAGATSYSQVDFAKINVAHSSYYDTASGTWYPAGTHPLYDTTGTWKLGPHPKDVKIKYCGLGARLRGLVVRSGAAVDAIDTLLCTDFKDVPFGVGGPGGFEKRQDCVFPPGAATWSSTKTTSGVYTRSGWYLDGLAMRCQL